MLWSRTEETKQLLWSQCPLLGAVGAQQIIALRCRDWILATPHTPGEEFLLLIKHSCTSAPKHWHVFINEPMNWLTDVGMYPLIRLPNMCSPLGKVGRFPMASVWHWPCPWFCFVFLGWLFFFTCFYCRSSFFTVCFPIRYSAMIFL